MKYAITCALLLSLAFPLSACDTPSGNAVQVTESFISDVQSDAKAICDVVPDALSVGALFSNGLATVSGMASAICDAIAGSPQMSVKRKIGSSMRTVHGPIVVRGVTVNFID